MLKVLKLFDVLRCWHIHFPSYVINTCVYIELCATYSFESAGMNYCRSEEWDVELNLTCFFVWMLSSSILSNILKKLTTWSIEKLLIFDLSRNVFWLFCVAPWDFPRVHWSRRIIPDVPASSERGHLRNVKVCKHFKKFSNSICNFKIDHLVEGHLLDGLVVVRAKSSWNTKTCEKLSEKFINIDFKINSPANFVLIQLLQATCEHIK